MPLPTLDELVEASHGFAVPLRRRFRGVDHREGLLLRGPVGWGEFAPFPEYGPGESARWLSAAIEAAWIGWPAPLRDTIPVNAIVPAVGPQDARRIVVEAGCSTAKVKVAEPGQSLDEDVARVAAVREALGPGGRVRIDANGAWSVDEADRALRSLSELDLEYAEQPCATLDECAQLRARTAVPVAVDEGVRKAADPTRVAGLREAADILVLKVAPLGGVRPALHVAQTYRLPCVVSSALDTSVGLTAGMALAAALPDLPYACGLASGRLLKTDVVADRQLPVGGRLEVRPVSVDELALREVAMSPARVGAWHQRLAAAFEQLTEHEAPA